MIKRWCIDLREIDKKIISDILKMSNSIKLGEAHGSNLLKVKIQTAR